MKFRYLGEKNLSNSVGVKLATFNHMVINLLAFDIIWFGLVFFGNNFIPISLLLLGVHLYFYGKFKGELVLIMVITAIGILVDSTLAYFNIFIFADSNHIPFWLIALWASFGATICHSLSFLERSKLLQFLVGGLLSPLSYIAGHKMEVVDFGLSLTSTYLVLSLVWGVLFVIFFTLKNHLVSGRVQHA